MNQGLIPRRYATALYKVDLERGTSGRSYGLMTALAEAFAANRDMQAVMSNPFVDAADKIRIPKTAAGAQDDDTTFNDFLKLLSENRRIDMTALIALSYCDIYRNANNIRRVQAVSATKLDEKTMDRIKELINKHIGNATMEFTTAVDPSIIGGFVINIDNTRLDSSVSAELDRLRLALHNQ